MSGQDPTNEKQEAAAPEATDTKASTAANGATVSLSEFEAIKAHKEKAVAELAGIREKERQRQAEHEARMREEGQYKGLAESHEKTIESLTSKIADLASIEGKASAYDAMVAAETQRVEAGIGELDPVHQEILRDIVDPLARAKHFDRLSGIKATAAAAATPSILPASASPSSGDEVDFAAEMKRGVPLRELKARYPKAWQAKMNGAHTTGRTSFGGRR